MKRRIPPARRKLGALALAAVIGASALAACGGGRDGAVSDQLDTQLQRVVDAAVDSPRTTFPGTALYVSQPELGTWSGAAGQRTLDPASSMRPTDTFRAGSIMKPFVATVVLQLVEEGHFALDDPLPAVLPGDVVDRIPEADRITVRMLLNHTSGIPEYSDEQHERSLAADPHRVWTLDELLELSASHPRRSKPGERYSYSNTNYNLLGLLVEETTGDTWREVVRERIIERLALEHTTLPEPGTVSLGDDRAHGYVPVDGRMRDFSDVDSSMAGAAGGHALVTTTQDLARFLNALLAGELFERSETLDEMLTFVEASDTPGLVGYGLGIQRYVLPGGVEVLGHAGGTAGYLAVVGQVPAHELDVAVAITSQDDVMAVLMPALKLMLDGVREDLS